jgi:large subunit ribosomal protein L31
VNGSKQPEARIIVSQEIKVKKDLHPEYKKCAVVCACGNKFETRSTVESMHLDICSKCHPFYTGKQKLVDTAGRVEKYLNKFKKTQQMNKGTSEKAAPEQVKTDDQAAQPAAE